MKKEMGQLKSKEENTVSIEDKAIKSRKNEMPYLFKKCFKNAMFSFVPYEIWRDLIVSNVELKSISLLSQTCWGFKELVDNIGENNLNLALAFRKEDQIPLALKYLQKCANNNNSTASYHLSYSYANGGFGLRKEARKSVEWCKKAADLGDILAFVRTASVVAKKFDEKKDILEKALASKNNHAIGYCHYYGIGMEGEGLIEGVKWLELSADEGRNFFF